MENEGDFLPILNVRVLLLYACDAAPLIDLVLGQAAPVRKVVVELSV